jgi:hypothetical protein
MSPKTKKVLVIFGVILFGFTLWSDPAKAAGWVNGAFTVVGHGIDSIVTFFDNLEV